MNEQRLSHLLKEIEAERIPAGLDLWPVIKERLDIRPSKEGRKMNRALVVLAGAILFLAMGLILVFPPARNAAAQIIQGIGEFVSGMAGGLGGPESYSPPPPFTVKLPGYLPTGFQYVGGEYHPGGNRVSVELKVVQLPGEEIEATQAGPWIIDQSRIPDVERDTDEAFIIARYQDRKGEYVEIFERQALPNEELPSGEERQITGQLARLQEAGQALIFTWIDADTWIELRSTLSEEGALKVAGGLVIIQRAGELKEGFRQSPYPGEYSGGALESQHYCHPDDGPANNGPANTGSLLLGKVPGQQNMGGVAIDFFDRDFFPETVGGGSNVTNMREGVYLPALKALQDPGLKMRRLPYKSIDIFMGTGQGCQMAPDDLQGYIVIEVWENQVNIGYGGQGNFYVQRAIGALEQEIKGLENKKP